MSSLVIVPHPLDKSTLAGSSAGQLDSHSFSKGISVTSASRLGGNLLQVFRSSIVGDEDSRNRVGLAVAGLISPGESKLAATVFRGM